jgi:hypothetical protein
MLVMGTAEQRRTRAQRNNEMGRCHYDIADLRYHTDDFEWKHLLISEA